MPSEPKGGGEIAGRRFNLMDMLWEAACINPARCRGAFMQRCEI